MSSITFFLFFIPVLAIVLLAINLIFAPHNPYQEKNSTFECGYHSFLGQNRAQFSISFFIFALLFLLFDLEILLVYPYVVSAYTNGILGLIIMLAFFLFLTLGFAFELGKNALKIESRQTYTDLSPISNGYRARPTATLAAGLYYTFLKNKITICIAVVIKVIFTKFIIYLFDLDTSFLFIAMYLGLINNFFIKWLLWLNPVNRDDTKFLEFLTKKKKNIVFLY